MALTDSVDERDEERFSAFLHMVRYISLPTGMIFDKAKESTLEAGF
jgi:hypothetical protein